MRRKHRPACGTKLPTTVAQPFFPSSVSEKDRTTVLQNPRRPRRFPNPSCSIRLTTDYTDKSRIKALPIRAIRVIRGQKCLVPFGYGSAVLGPFSAIPSLLRPPFPHRRQRCLELARKFDLIPQRRGRHLRPQSRPNLSQTLRRISQANRDPHKLLRTLRDQVGQTHIRQQTDAHSRMMRLPPASRPALPSTAHRRSWSCLGRETCRAPRRRCDDI